MSHRELILLSPYRFPGRDSLMLGNEDVSCFLNGYTALWHPAAAWGAAGPPKVASPYDHEQPAAGVVYALPESPPLFLPDDWDQRLRDVGAVSFRATADRPSTLVNLFRALEDLGQAPPAHRETDPASYVGVGLGYAFVETLFDAMEHEHLLSGQELWQDIQASLQAAINGDEAAAKSHLQTAADRLVAAREVLYPTMIHLLDFRLVEEANLEQPWPATFDHGLPLTLIGPSAVFEKLSGGDPNRWTALRDAVAKELVEICGGCQVEREDAILPLESQRWNLLKGLATAKRLFDRDIQVFARKRFAFHPALPTLLNHVGLRRILFLPFDDAILPSYQSATVNWSTPDGKQLDAFTRAPHQADNPQLFFHWAHYLHRTIMQDHMATLVISHSATPACPWFGDLLALSRLAPVFGQWTTLSRFLSECYAGEYVSLANPDEFHGDYLSERTNAHSEQPVSVFPKRIRRRRRIDAAWTFAGLLRGLPGPAIEPEFLGSLVTAEDRSEEREDAADEEMHGIEASSAERLAGRLLNRAQESGSGFLVLNPCSFARRVVLELENQAGPPSAGGPVKASQLDGSTARAVVEVPGLGFAWIPAGSATSAAPPSSRMKMADQRAVRNEFFEAEIDPTTGGLRGIHDHRTRVSRIGQQLVFNPGSQMRLKEVKVVSTGPALGEVVTDGTISDEQDLVLAEYRQTYRAWLGRPVLDLKIEIRPVHPPQGYSWHAYYGARFAWRDEKAVLLRGVHGLASATTHTRPESPDFLELRSARQSTSILTAGLPFHQRHGSRMLDVLLITEGETATAFDLTVALDRDLPMQTALGLVTPVTVVPAPKGPPHIGPVGWLFHLDVTNLLLTAIRPASDGADAVIVHMRECTGQHTQAELRCPRDPVRAYLVDAFGVAQMEATLQGDAVLFEVGPGDLAFLRVEFV